MIQNNPNSRSWEPKDCQNCPVPDILLANSSPHLVLEGSVKRGLLGVNRRIAVTAFCSKHLIDVPLPQVGCPQCALERPDMRALFGEE